MPHGITVRRATAADLPAAGRLAGELVRMHNQTDPGRFMLVDGVEEGYARWFAREIEREGAVVLVALEGGTVVGYAYGTLQGRDWNALLDAHGAVHDILVREESRRGGTGRLLLDALVWALEGLGARRIVLSTMVGNIAAQALFKSRGFRPTMLEMTLGGDGG